MAFLIDAALDALVTYVDTNGTRLDICSQEPTTYGQATTDATYSLGYKTGISIAAASDRTPNGRKVTVGAITDGTVTHTATASHWAITNGSDTLIATGALSSTQAVTDGNVFTLAAFDIGVPDAT